jgi:hypothetical protein
VLAFETSPVDPKGRASPEDWDMDEDVFEELLGNIPNNGGASEELLDSTINDEDAFEDAFQDFLESIPIIEGGPEEFLDSLSDEDRDFEELISSLPNHEMQGPTSSVVRAHDCESRSAEDFDPNLRHSSLSIGSSDTVKSKDGSPLEEDVDWTVVHESARVMKKTDGSSGSQKPYTPTTVGHLASQSVTFDSRSRVQETPPGSRPSSFPARMLLKPHKTFFDISEMLEAKMQLFKHQPDAIYELFARVVYSSRENFHRKQYFQFRGLLKECPPYINGTLMG